MHHPMSPLQFNAMASWWLLQTGEVSLIKGWPVAQRSPIGLSRLMVVRRHLSHLQRLVMPGLMMAFWLKVTARGSR